jgi:hypothetical protein
MPARDQGILRTRIPDELMDRLQEAATANRRSVAAEVAYRLERSFVDPDLLHAIGLKLDTAMLPVAQELRALQFQFDTLTKRRKA